MNKTRVSEITSKMKDQISKVFAGKEDKIDMLILGLFSGLHVLIEDIPGVGKTTLARSLAASCGMDFGRIQFTPDLLPGDITGLYIWEPVKRDFVYKQGSIVHEFILADEINRATSRTQSALLEAMQEGSVSVDGQTIPLPDSFFVVATQNPNQFTGTFVLPEAQIDRFGLSLSLGYPSVEVESRILALTQIENPYSTIEQVCSSRDVLEIRRQAKTVEVASSIRNYIIQIAEKTRNHSSLRLGLSPRGSQHVYIASRLEALLNRRTFVIPEDVLKVISPVVRHRLLLTSGASYNKETVDSVLSEILSQIKIPVGV